jgi:hypothetical protein
MTLSDLPKMMVDRIDRTADGTKVHGRFDRLAGVRENGYFRLARCSYVWASLRFNESDPGAVEFTDDRDPAVSKLLVGERYTWLDDYWNAPLVEAIADETTAWRPMTFRTTDAQWFHQGDVTGWQPIGQPLPTGAAALETQPGGWDHEHCDLCGRRIDVEASMYFTDPEDHRLCSQCYEKYGRRHDVSFQVGA